MPLITPAAMQRTTTQFLWNKDLWCSKMSRTIWRSLVEALSRSSCSWIQTFALISGLQIRKVRGSRGCIGTSLLWWITVLFIDPCGLFFSTFPPFVFYCGFIRLPWRCIHSTCFCFFFFVLICKLSQLSQLSSLGWIRDSVSVCIQKAKPYNTSWRSCEGICREATIKDEGRLKNELLYKKIYIFGAAWTLLEEQCLTKRIPFKHKSFKGFQEHLNGLLCNF